MNKLVKGFMLLKNVVRLSTIFLVILTLLAPQFKSPQQAMASSSTQVGVGRVRFVNATADGNPVEVYVDDQYIAGNLRLDAGFFTFNSGIHVVSFRETIDQEIVRLEINLESASRQTVALMGNSVSGYRIGVFIDDASTPPQNFARIQVINAVVDSSAETMYIDGETWSDPIGYGQITEPRAILGGGYSLSVGDEPHDFVFSPGRYYMIFYAADDSNEPRIVNVVGLPSRGNDTTRFRFMNIVENEDGATVEYDVYINQAATATFEDVSFRQVTHEFVVAPGDYAFDVFEHGVIPSNTSAVASINVNIEESQSLLILASGSTDLVELLVFADDLTPVPVNTSRLQVINLTETIPEFGVFSQAGIQLIDRVNYGAMVSRNIPGGNYAFSLVDADDPLNAVGSAEDFVGSGQIETVVIYGQTQQRFTAFNEPLEQVAQVRFVHADYSAGQVDIYLNGSVILNNLDYKETSEYLTFVPGAYDLEVYRQDESPENGEPIFSDDLTITGNAVAFTMAFIGGRVVSYADNLEIIPPARARVRFVHAASIVPSLSVINRADNSILAGGLAYRQGSGNLTLRSSTRTFTFVEVGVGQIYEISGFELEQGSNHLFILIGDADQPETLETIILSIAP